MELLLSSTLAEITFNKTAANKLRVQKLYSENRFGAGQISSPSHTGASECISIFCTNVAYHSSTPRQFAPMYKTETASGNAWLRLTAQLD